ARPHQVTHRLRCAEAKHQSRRDRASSHPRLWPPSLEYRVRRWQIRRSENSLLAGKYQPSQSPQLKLSDIVKNLLSALAATHKCLAQRCDHFQAAAALRRSSEARGERAPFLPGGCDSSSSSDLVKRLISICCPKPTRLAISQ